jgi:kumamolisin
VGTRPLGVLALIAAIVSLLVSDLRPTPHAADGPSLIAGPYSYLLASSTDLGPSHNRSTQVTAA